MKFFYATVLSSCLLASTVMAAERFIPDGDAQAEDGDTVIITIDSQPQRIQLAGIDAPEDVDNPKLQVDIKRSGLAKKTLLKIGRIATEQLRFLLKNQSPLVLHFNPQQRDRYGRIPGDLVNAAGESIAAQMIANGYAIVNQRAIPPSLSLRLQALQQAALRQHKGLWGLHPKTSRRWAGLKDQ